MKEMVMKTSCSFKLDHLPSPQWPYRISHSSYCIQMYDFSFPLIVYLLYFPLFNLNCLLVVIESHHFYCSVTLDSLKTLASVCAREVRSAAFWLCPWCKYLRNTHHWALQLHKAVSTHFYSYINKNDSCSPKLQSLERKSQRHWLIKTV